MPRYRKNILTSKERQERSQNTRVRSQGFIDPFPEMHGTLPEKMVYAEFSRRGIPFLFLNDIDFAIPEIDFMKTYQADFVIPSIKMIIEVQGAYWHSKPEALEADAFKLAVYESTGWKALAWWDYEILDDLSSLIYAQPELLALSTSSLIAGKSTELPVQKRTKVDTSKGIRTLNERRFRAKMPTTSRRKIRKATGFYES